MAKPRKPYAIYSFLMASLFAASASVQFNDPDWFFWFPLYACASLVNLISCCWTSSTNSCKAREIAERYLRKLALWLGVFLFIKVVIEDYGDGIAGFWSSDMKEKVVREKFGSGLVVISMVLHSAAAETRDHRNRNMEEKKKKEKKNIMRKLAYIEYGMAVLVGVSFGLSFLFIFFHKQDMKF